MTDGEARCKRSITVIGHSPDVVELRSGVWNSQSTTITDRAGNGHLLAIIQGLDGSETYRELAGRLGVSRKTVTDVVEHMTGLGVMEYGSTSALDAYLDTVHTLRSPAVAQATVERVLLIGDPDLTRRLPEFLEQLPTTDVEIVQPDHPLALALSGTDRTALHDGLQTAELVEGLEVLSGSFIVSAESVVHPPRAQLLNRISLELAIPWIHAALDGPFVLIGPTVVPGRSPCFECFETRVGMNLRESASYQRYKNALVEGRASVGPPAVLPAVQGLLATHTALEVTNFVECDSNFTIGKVFGIHLPTMELSFSELLRLPGCRACGSHRGRDDDSLYFDARAWLDA